ncbi:MAG TPA: cytochrome c oxidase subunit II [Candidatus Caldiarchaeum subterraneum]|uniref:cytochrome-c oxidase n=1 Tax=Caldiarchaeum subterraneum TaxID=311458 RepID=A0A832ZVG6_CALS0|nr:cytochrome c oxidase subunit II [Aigarchaeota archaeon]HIQ29650.1 cytochrome c oxidase subunit II [Candidatus Caldarchaeum subterraneum]
MPTIAELSPITSQWQSLFNLYLTIGTVTGVVVISLLVVNTLRYRDRPGRQNPSDAIEEAKIPAERGTIGAALLLTLIVAGILFAITIGTMATVDLIEKPPKGTLHINVEGFQWGWRFTYPNGRETVNEVRIPAGEVTVFYVTSTDVFHKFQLVEFKIGVDAIPGKVNKIWISTEKAGEYLIQCYELCGVGHAVMAAKLIVMEPSEFKAWYEGGGA